MKNILLTILLATASAFAQTLDTEIKVERRTLDRQDKIAKPRKDAQELTRGLRITVKNTGLKPAAEGEVEWAILVARPGQQRALYSSGTEKLKALKTAETATFDVGSIAVQQRNGDKQDMEYRVVVRRGSEEAAKSESVATFEQQAESARGNGRKKNK